MLRPLFLLDVTSDGTGKIKTFIRFIIYLYLVTLTVFLIGCNLSSALSSQILSLHIVHFSTETTLHVKSKQLNI